jgi:hypothetical protein
MSGARDLVLPPALQAGKAATASLIRAFGGQEAAAGETGKRQSRFSDYGSPHTADFITIADVRTLETATHGTPGHPHVTRWLARQTGHVLVRLPVGPTAASLDIHVELGAVAKETSEVVQKVCEGLGDGRLDGEDCRRLRIRDEIAEAQERLAALDALVAQVEAEG